LRMILYHNRRDDQLWAGLVSFVRSSGMARVDRRPRVAPGRRLHVAGRKRRVGDRPVVYRSLGWAERVGVLGAVISASAALLTVAITGYSTSRSLKATNDQLSIAQQGQVTDRFGRAVEQLGSAAMDVRLGGIYSLERLARDSPPDQPTIVKVLSS